MSAHVLFLFIKGVGGKEMKSVACLAFYLFFPTSWSPDKSAYLKTIFFISHPNICCRYSKEPSHPDFSFEHPNTCLN